MKYFFFLFFLYYYQKSSFSTGICNLTTGSAVFCQLFNCLISTLCIDTREAFVLHQFAQSVDLPASETAQSTFVQGETSASVDCKLALLITD